jgi:hypothetical protein
MLYSATAVNGLSLLSWNVLLSGHRHGMARFFFSTECEWNPSNWTRATQAHYIQANRREVYSRVLLTWKFVRTPRWLSCSISEKAQADLLPVCRIKVLTADPLVSKESQFRASLCPNCPALQLIQFLYMPAIATEMFFILLQPFTTHVSAPTGHRQVEHNISRLSMVLMNWFRWNLLLASKFTFTERFYFVSTTRSHGLWKLSGGSWDWNSKIYRRKNYRAG